LPDELEIVIDGLAYSFVDADGCNVADAERLIRQLVTHARQAYRAAGAPYGDSVAGFLIWLDSANRLTPSA
jgi:hypothetical protein